MYVHVLHVYMRFCVAPRSVCLQSLCCKCTLLSTRYFVLNLDVSTGACAAPGGAESSGVFRLVSKKRFVCFGCFGAGSKNRNKPNNCFRFHETNRKTTESDWVSVSSGLNRKYILFDSRTPLSKGMKINLFFIQRYPYPCSEQRRPYPGCSLDSPVIESQ
jgi:hypothetical protein